jgi:hypothetical protein
MAFGCETFVFVYMGMSLSLYEQAGYAVRAAAQLCTCKPCTHR